MREPTHPHATRLPGAGRQRLRPRWRSPTCWRGRVARERDRRARPRGQPLRRPRPSPPADARSACIFLYMPGGPSHVDLFDPKPRLADDNGKPLPFEKPKLERTKTGNLLASPWKFAQARPVRHRGQRAAAAPGARTSTTSA